MHALSPQSLRRDRWGCADGYVENWFSRIQRNVITRGVFTSIANLRIKLMRYIRHYNKTATPIRWTYSDPSKRIKA